MNVPAGNSTVVKGRPALDVTHTYDVDTAQHFLADHAADIVVAFDHDATDPSVKIYTLTPEGVLSPGDYYLWPLLHRTSERLSREIDAYQRSHSNYFYSMDLRRLRKWQRRMPQLTTLIRIRKACVQALCSWDLGNGRPDGLTVVNTARDLTGVRMDNVPGLAQHGSGGE